MIQRASVGALATWPSPFPFDTIANGASPTPCTSTADDRGCYNTYTYYYSTDYVCENYLLKYSDYGCCDGIPYRVCISNLLLFGWKIRGQEFFSLLRLSGGLLCMIFFPICNIVINNIVRLANVFPRMSPQSLQLLTLRVFPRPLLRLALYIIYCRTLFTANFAANIFTERKANFRAYYI